MANEIPLNLFIVMNLISLGFFVFSLIHSESVIRIVSSFISTVLSYVNSMVLLGANVVMITDIGTYVTIINTTYAYFWQFMAVLSGFFLLLFIADAINTAIQPELNEEEMMA